VEREKQLWGQRNSRWRCIWELYLRLSGRQGRWGKPRGLVTLLKSQATHIHVITHVLVRVTKPSRIHRPCQDRTFLGATVGVQWWGWVMWGEGEDINHIHLFAAPWRTHTFDYEPDITILQPKSFMLIFHSYRWEYGRRWHCSKLWPRVEGRPAIPAHNFQLP